MKAIKSLIITSLCSISLYGHAHNHVDPQLAKAVQSEQRSDKNKARDQYRHPLETLTFFGFRSDMTVVEILPGGGWYTEILAPALKGKGTFYAAHYPDTGEDNYYSNSRKKVEKLLTSDDVFSEVILLDFDPKKTSQLAPAGSADLVLTFRNLHNWQDAGVEQAFKDAYQALKVGGVLGVVQHRLPKGEQARNQSGYYSQEKTIEIAKKVGFELAQASELNANAKDNTQHPKGVWTLPPVLRLGDKDKEKYLAIGESDRMTLKFVKFAE